MLTGYRLPGQDGGHRFRISLLATRCNAARSSVDARAEGNQVGVGLAIAPNLALPPSAEQNGVMLSDTRLQIVFNTFAAEDTSRFCKAERPESGVKKVSYLGVITSHSIMAGRLSPRISRLVFVSYLSNWAY